jgi:hypothetical protein
LHVSWGLHFVSEKNNPSDSEFQIIGAFPIVDHCVLTLYLRHLLLPTVSVVPIRSHPLRFEHTNCALGQWWQTGKAFDQLGRDFFRRLVDTTWSSNGWRYSYYVRWLLKSNESCLECVFLFQPFGLFVIYIYRLSFIDWRHYLSVVWPRICLTLNSSSRVIC